MQIYSPAAKYGSRGNYKVEKIMKALRKRIVNFLPYAVLEIVGIFLL